MADSLFALYPNSVLLLNLDEKKQVTSPEIFPGEVTSLRLNHAKLFPPVAEKARAVVSLSLGPG